MAVTAFQETLLLLVYLTGGQPPRRKELTTLQWANSWSRMRNIFVVDGTVAVITEYNKSEVRSGRPKVVVRYLPRAVGRMVVAFVAEVVPFAEFLDVCCGRPLASAETRSLLWHRDGQAWPEDDLTQLVRTATWDGLKVQMGPRDWRNVAVAVDVEKIRPQLSVEDDVVEAINHTYQAGHGPDVERAHYGLTAADLVGTSARTLAKFFDCSARFHRFMGLSPAPDDSRGAGRAVSLQSLDRKMTTTLTAVKNLGMLRNAGTTSASAPPAVPEQPRPTGRAMEPGQMDQVKQAMLDMYGSADFKSDGQEEAVREMFTGSGDLFVVLPTGAGKSLLIELSASVGRDKVTIVVVPLLLLRDNLIDRCRAKHLQVCVFSRDEPANRSVVFVTPEQATTDSFRTYRTALSAEGRLARVIFDECHQLVTESRFRPAFVTMMVGWGPSDVRRVFMTGTLPAEMAAELKVVANVDLNRWSEVRRSCQVSTVRWEVDTIMGDLGARALRLLGGLKEDDKALIYVTSVAGGTLLSERHNWPFFHGGMGDEGLGIRRGFERGEFRVLCATTAAGVGWDIDADLVILFGGSFDLITAAQQAGRAGRRSRQVGRCVVLVQHGWSRTMNGTPGKEAMRELVETNRCRRSVLGAYLDGRWKANCGPSEVRCDNCDKVVTPNLLMNSSWAFRNTLDDSSSLPRPRWKMTSPHPVDDPIEVSSDPTADGGIPSALLSTSTSANTDHVTERTHVSETPEPWQSDPPKSSRKRNASLTSWEVSDRRFHGAKRVRDDAVSSSVSLPPVTDTQASREPVPVRSNTALTASSSSMISSPSSVSLQYRDWETKFSPFITTWSDSRQIRIQLGAATKGFREGGIQCPYCWLEGGDGFNSHVWDDCPRVEYDGWGFQQMDATRKQAKFKCEWQRKRTHTNCFLPNNECHEAYFDMGAQCWANGWLYSMVMAAMRKDNIGLYIRRRWKVNGIQENELWFTRLFQWHGDRQNVLMVWEVWLAVLDARKNNLYS